MVHSNSNIQPSRDQKATCALSKCLVSSIIELVPLPAAEPTDSLLKHWKFGQIQVVAQEAILFPLAAGRRMVHGLLL